MTTYQAKEKDHGVSWECGANFHLMMHIESCECVCVWYDEKATMTIKQHL